jgi:polyhydroxyalkanoate synthesis regulator protein
MDEPKLAVFPVELLHRLIQSNESLMRDFVEKYFNQALMVFLESRQKFEEQLRGAVGLGMVPPQAMDWARMVGAPFVAPFAAGAAQPPKAPAAAAPDTRTEELERAVRELQQRVKSLHGKKRVGDATRRPKRARRPRQR